MIFIAQIGNCTFFSQALCIPALVHIRFRQQIKDLLKFCKPFGIIPIPDFLGVIDILVIPAVRTDRLVVAL